MNSMEKLMLFGIFFALRKAYKGKKEKSSGKTRPDERTATESERKFTNTKSEARN